jgi:succinate dehydrogenase / fumarate reductase iron-sulfur subunit
MRFKIFRSGPGGKDSRYEVYEVDPKPGMSVLEALFDIQERYDDGLAFRYSCRGAVCGSCAMTINREPRLACRTQLTSIAREKPLGLKLFPGLAREVAWRKLEEVLVEPLPNLPILRDLIVDMDPFFEAYKRVKPWLEPADQEAGPSRMSPEEVMRLDKYANCILCAACYSSCPVNDKDKAYLGPAALSWAWRFIDDPRVADRTERLESASGEQGAGGCEFAYNCVKVCPRGVAPASAIRSIKTMSRSGQ